MTIPSHTPASIFDQTRFIAVVEAGNDRHIARDDAAATERAALAAADTAWRVARAAYHAEAGRANAVRVAAHMDADDRYQRAIVAANAARALALATEGAT